MQGCAVCTAMTDCFVRVKTCHECWSVCSKGGLCVVCSVYTLQRTTHTCATLDWSPCILEPCELRLMEEKSTHCLNLVSVDGAQINTLFGLSVNWWRTNQPFVWINDQLMEDKQIRPVFELSVNWWRTNQPFVWVEKQLMEDELNSVWVEYQLIEDKSTLCLNWVSLDRGQINPLFELMINWLTNKSNLCLNWVSVDGGRINSLFELSSNWSRTNQPFVSIEYHLMEEQSTLCLNWSSISWWGTNQTFVWIEYHLMEHESILCLKWVSIDGGQTNQHFVWIDYQLMHQPFAFQTKGKEEKMCRGTSCKGVQLKS